MRVQMSLLLKEFYSEHSCIVGSHYTPDTAIDRVRLCHDNLETKRRDTLYIATAEEAETLLSQVKPHRVIVLVSPEAAGEPPQIPCSFYVVTSVSPEALAHDVYAIIRRYQHWSDEMFAMLSDDKSIEDLVKTGHRVLQNPIAVFDESLKTYVNTTYDAIDDSLWVETSKESYADAFSATGVRHQWLFKHLKSEGSVPHFLTHDGNDATVCLVGRNQDYALAALLSAKNHSIEEGDIACFKHFCEILALKIKLTGIANETINNQTSLFLIDLVTGSFKSLHEINICLRNLGIDEASFYYAVVVKSRTLHLTNTALKRVEEAIQENVAGSYTALHKNCVVALIRCNSPLSSSLKELTQLSKYFESQSLNAAISDACVSLDKLSGSYWQAKTALRISESVMPDKPLVSFSECRLYLVYDACISRHSIDDYLHPCFTILKEHDTSTGNSLYETLVTYLKNHLVQTETSKALYIQRNTLLYRLKKIEELCDIDLHDPDTIFTLEFSVRLLEYQT